MSLILCALHENENLDFDHIHTDIINENLTYISELIIDVINLSTIHEGWAFTSNEKFRIINCFYFPAS